MKKSRKTTAEETAVTDKLLSHLLFRSECPTADELLLYQAGLLSPQPARQVQTHLKLCQYCQEEAAVLATVSVPAAQEARFYQLAEWLAALRQAGYRVLEALLQLETRQPLVALRGDNVQTSRYEAGEYQISLGTTATVGQTAVWQLSGQLWSTENPYTNYSGELFLFAQDELRQQAKIDELGTFAIGEMETGHYTLIFKLKSDILKVDPFSIP